MAKTKKEPGSTEVTITPRHGTFSGIHKPWVPPLTQLCIRQLRLKWGERYIQTVGPQGYAHLGYREASQSLW